MSQAPIKCIQCYSYGQSYLVVNESVHGIIPFQGYAGETKAPWHLGYTQWEDTPMPVINLDCKPLPVEKLPHGHMLILKCFGGEKPRYVGIIIGQIARTLEIKPEDLSFNGEAQGHLYPVKGAQLIGHIVDVEKLTQTLLDNNIIA